MIEKLIARAFKVRNVTHVKHWKTNSYAQHKALGHFYEDLVESLDKYVEAYQGTYGLIGDMPEDVPNIVKVLRDELVWLNENREKVACNIPALENIVDEMTANYMKTLYKLENLR